MWTDPKQKVDLTVMRSKSRSINQSIHVGITVEKWTCVQKTHRTMKMRSRSDGKKTYYWFVDHHIMNYQHT